ncbi:MAG: hypothetical protein HYS12_19045 [Planctomycetes bacterium]|nr:hypothetical protein [Planctomycetota bacterium]
MFGLMNPGRQDTVFRRAYARCCQHQRRTYGLTSLGFLSYESVLLYLFALDAGKLTSTDLPGYTCCRLRSLPPRTSPAEREVARFCASLGLLLAHVKVTDDIRDRGSLGARLFRWALRRRFRTAFDYFERLDGQFARRVEQFITGHLALEKVGRALSLEDYARPTAEAFRYVFGLMARLPGLESRHEVLARLGEHVGAAIIAFDCAADWHKDRRRGEFNPLPDGEASVQAALASCRDRLARAAVECRLAFGAASHTARALAGVRARIPHLCNRARACEEVRASTETRLQGWGLVRKKGAFQVNSGWELWAAAGTVFAFGLSTLRWFFASGPHVPEDLPPANVPDDLPGVIEPGPVPPIELEVPVVTTKQPSGKKKLQACDDCDLPCVCCLYGCDCSYCVFCCT